MKHGLLSPTVLLSIVLAVQGCGADSGAPGAGVPGGPAVGSRAAAAADRSGEIATPSGLRYLDLKSGEGAQPAKGKVVEVYYTGWLTSGRQFDSCLEPQRPFQFVLGQGLVIPGWDEGIATMKVGGKRKLVIPADLGYGTRGFGDVIPPNATLVFEVELVGVK